MADVHGSPADAPQGGQLDSPGTPPVPYTGAMPSEPPAYGVTLAVSDAAAEVMNGIPPMPGLSEQPWAHDVSAGSADAPYYPGLPDPIEAMGDPDPGGRDDVAATVQGSVDAATARWHEHMSDLGAGGTIGDLMHFPPSPLDPGAGTGNTTPAGGFFDPPRDYGGAAGAPGYQGEAI